MLGTHPLDLPERSLTTKAVWWTVPDDVLAAAGVEATRVPGALHAAEHAAIGMLPLVATSDRWDVGGVSTALHPDTGEPTIMVFDGYPGGAGFAERGYAAFEAWVRATRDAVLGCRVRDRVPGVRPVAEVRQRQRAARQGRRGDGARAGARPGQCTAACALRRTPPVPSTARIGKRPAHEP